MLDRKAQQIFTMLDQIGKQKRKEKEIMRYVSKVNKVKE